MACDTFDMKFFRVLQYVVLGCVILIVLIQLKTIDDNLKYLVQVQQDSNVDTTTTKTNVTEEEK